LLQLLRVPSIVMAINKLDAVDNPTQAFQHIRQALLRFAEQAGIEVAAVVPVSALLGHNVAQAEPGWCGYPGPCLLDILHGLPTTPAERHLPLSAPVQWVEKHHDRADTHQGRRIFWTRLATGQVQVGDTLRVFPSGQTAQVAQVLNTVRQAQTVGAGQSAGIVLDREVDISRGDWLLAPDSAAAPWQKSGQTEIRTTVAWLDDEPLVVGRVYWALHGHRWVKAKVKAIDHRIDIHTLAATPAQDLPANAMGQVVLGLQQALPACPFAVSRPLGSLVLVDPASHRTAGAALVLA
jgi:sulfate adenylyltransferase subunit 1